jgi:hypothetical protein
MNTLSDYLQQAELALAAYSTFTPGLPPAVSALQDSGRGMALRQAQNFASTYVVAAQYTDANGLSATVFADAAGNTYLAIRGTEMTAQDLLTDIIDIGLFGTTAFQSQYASLKAKVQEWLGNGTLPQSFTVAGHSLGGLLATGNSPEIAANLTHTNL